MATVRIKGGKKLNQFLRKAKAAKGVQEIEVGFYSTAKYSETHAGKNGGRRQEPLPVTNVAAFNEFGTKNIPERPFFRQAIQTMQDPLLDILKENVDPRTMVVDRNTAGKLGIEAQAQIQESIVRLDRPPNSPATIKLKGSSNPLIDTGFLKNSVVWKVVG